MTQSFPVGLRTNQIYSLYLWASVLDIYFEIKVLGKPWRYWIRYIDIYRKRYGLLAWGKPVAFTMVDTKIPWTNKHKQEINKSRYLIEHPINSLFVFFVCAIFVILASTFLYAWRLSLGELPNLWVNVSWGGVLHPNPRSTLLPKSKVATKMLHGTMVYLTYLHHLMVKWWFGVHWGAPKNPNPFHNSAISGI